MDVNGALRRLAGGAGFLVYFILVMAPVVFLVALVSLLAGPAYWIATGQSWPDVVECWLKWVSGPLDFLLDSSQDTP